MMYLSKDKYKNLMQSLLHLQQNGMVVVDNLSIICDDKIFRNKDAVISVNFNSFRTSISTILIRIKAERIDTKLPLIYSVWILFRELVERGMLTDDAIKVLQPYIAVPVLEPSMHKVFVEELYKLNVYCTGIDVCFDYFERNTTEKPFRVLNINRLNTCGSTIYSRDIGVDVTASLLSVYDRGTKLINGLGGVIPEVLAGTQYWRLCFRMYEPYLDGTEILYMNLEQFISYFSPLIKPRANELFGGAVEFKPHPNHALLSQLADIQVGDFEKRGT